MSSYLLSKDTTMPILAILIGPCLMLASLALLASLVYVYPTFMVYGGYVHHALLWVGYPLALLAFTYGGYLTFVLTSVNDVLDKGDGYHDDLDSTFPENAAPTPTPTSTPTPPPDPVSVMPSTRYEVPTSAYRLGDEAYMGRSVDTSVI